MGFELRALGLLGRHLIACGLAIFQIVSQAQVSLDYDPPVCTSHIVKVTGDHAQLYWLRWGLTNFLPSLALNHSPPTLYLPE
jgi:hypothetical protein